MQPSNSGYSIDIRIEEIKLPPFQEVLVVAKNSPHGKIGILKSFELLAPDGFEVIEADHELIEVVFINKRILKKTDRSIVMEILANKVFPFISEGEILKVDFKVTIFHNSVTMQKNETV